jgi:hypothetical protein
MAVATISAANQFQLGVSILAGLILAALTFGASAWLAASTFDRSPAASLAVQLGGFVVRLSLVAVALVACVNLLHLQAVPLAIGLTGGFTVLAFAGALRELRRQRPVSTRD